MGLLDADLIRQKLKGLLGDMPISQMVRGQSHPITREGLLGALKSMPIGPDPQAAYDAALNIGPMLMGKIVYHGSPHKFDKFDASKIGTGEGAQAYGHGVYLADSPGVAESYKSGGGAFQKTSPAPNVMIGDKWAQNMPRDSLESQAATVFANDLFGKTIPEKVQKLRSSNLGPVADFLEKNASQFRLDNGALYKADLPDEWIPKMLDWDKPLSQQTPEIQQAITGDLTAHLQAQSDAARASLTKKFADKGLPSPFKNGGSPVPVDTWAGERLMKSLGDMYGPANVAEILRQKGIPGIRYLDGSSRGAGQGTYNYVVFPGLEDKVKILERNGVPINGLLGGK